MAKSDPYMFVFYDDNSFSTEERKTIVEQKKSTHYEGRTNSVVDIPIPFEGPGDASNVVKTVPAPEPYFDARAYLLVRDDGSRLSFSDEPGANYHDAVELLAENFKETSVDVRVVVKSDSVTDGGLLDEDAQLNKLGGWFAELDLDSDHNHAEVKFEFA